VDEYEDLNPDCLSGWSRKPRLLLYYSIYYVPALLQTADYTKAIIKAIAAKMDPDMPQQRVEARLRRQQRLDDADRPLCRPSLVPRPVTFAPAG
jgi:hypothetical protein